MTKTVLSYSVASELDNYLNKEVGKRMANNGGVKVLKKEVIGELAEYCELTWGGIDRIKRGLATPSLPVALKIAEYFNERVENIFKLS